MTIDTTALSQEWQKLKQAEPQLRIKDCAEKLGVSEAALVATKIGETTFRLEADWMEFVSRLPELGRVMSLTRNDNCVLEHKGVFETIDLIKGGHPMATVIGPIETRVFFSGWKYGFKDEIETPRGTMKSLQIFDGSGTAVTKIYLQPDSNEEAFYKLATDFKAQDQSTDLEFSNQPAMPTLPIGEVDQAAFLDSWDSMKDTHDFFGMLRRFKVDRQDALQLAEGRFTRKIAFADVEKMLNHVATHQLPIMVFVGNRGNIQIHQDVVRNVKPMEGWLNVMDPDFNMHLKTTNVGSTWVVEKPTNDGTVTSIEVFDTRGEMIVQFFGLRKPGIPERKDWRALVAELA